MIRAIIFDLDDTLYEYERLNKEAIEVVCNFVCERYSISREKFKHLLEKARSETKLILQNTGASHNRLLYYQKLLEYLGQCPAEAAIDLYEMYWGYMLNHMQLRPHVTEVLRYCKSRNIKIGICSDLTAYIQHRKIRRLGLASWVDCIVTSEEAGKEKPDQKIFTMILAKLKVSPQEAIFVGDNLEKDIKGAEQAGMKGIWFNQENHIKDVISISSFVQLKGILDECE